jgi:hypothetical protein
MTTSVKIHVNGRYRAMVTQDDLAPVIVEGNYEGSSNPSGEQTFWLSGSHPTQGNFKVVEEYVGSITPSSPDPLGR